MRRWLVPRVLLAALSGLGAFGCGGRDGGGHVVRIGHFPNLTHVQGLVAHALAREGKGRFEEAFGPGVRVEWYLYNAGPFAMEAMLSGDLDMAYVGPSPALNAHMKSGGDEVRILAGAMRGGSALVVQGDARIKSAADFRGRRVATPQFGNTQDVACRAWLTAQGFHVTQTGGDVHVQPTLNPDLLSLFSTGVLDAAWTVEPWVSRLETEAGAHVFLEESTPSTTVFVASAAFLRDHRELASKAVRVNADLTDWVVKSPAEAKALVRRELKEETHVALAEDLLDRCWPRLHPDTAVAVSEFEAFVRAAQDAGFLRSAGSLDRFVEKP